MKNIFVMLVILIHITGICYAFDIKKYCREVADTVGGSYQIEEACRELEIKSRNNLNRMSIPTRIKNYCWEVANAVGGSYQIMEACVEQEIAAKNRLNYGE